VQVPESVLTIYQSLTNCTFIPDYDPAYFEIDENGEYEVGDICLGFTLPVPLSEFESITWQALWPNSAIITTTKANKGTSEALTEYIKLNNIYENSNTTRIEWLATKPGDSLGGICILEVRAFGKTYKKFNFE